MTRSNIIPMIDALGETRTRIAKLQANEAVLKQQTADLGPGTHVGSRYVALV